MPHVSGGLTPSFANSAGIVSRLVVALAWAGVLPMLGCVIFLQTPLGVLLLKSYSLAIIAFLSGSWWSTALITQGLVREQRGQVLLLCNGIVLVGIAGVVFMDDRSLLLLGALYGCLLWGERSFPAFGKQPSYYRLMRAGVTCAVMILHLLAYWLSL